MPLKAILKLIGLQPIPAKKPKPQRREHQIEEWESIGSTLSYGMTETEDLGQVPEWLKKEWNKVRGTTRTLGGKWKISEGVEDPEASNFNEGYSGTGYFRNGKKFKYMVVAWDGMQGSTGEHFYRKRKRAGK